MSRRGHWINTVSREHVLAAAAGGFTQADHGRPTRLESLALGDLVAFYSPRTAMRDGAQLQCFTAIGRVEDDAPYQVEMTPTFHPWRRRLVFLPSTEAPVRPLLERLDFITDKKKWGLPFRRGLFAVSAADFARIAKAMDAEL